MSEKLRKHLDPTVDERRLARQWAAISARGPKRRGSFATVAPWALAAGLALALALVWRGGRAPALPPAVASSALTTSYESAEGSAVVALGDGTRVTLDAHSRLDVVTATQQSVRVRLARGAALFDVRHDPARVFVVEAGATTVSDVGTEFRVSYADSGAVQVDVRSGAVRLERPTGGTELHAGETWSSEGAPPPASATTSAPPTATIDAGTTPASMVPDRDPDRVAFVAFEKLAPDDPAAAFDSLGAERFARLVGRSSAKDLWQLANAARLSAHPRDAANAYDALRHRFRDDARAGLAAFELGRLRQDKLGDVAGAEEAYADAVALAPDASFREDAESRRIEALDALGRTSACVDARAAYLARHPAGVHAATVAWRCGGK